MAVSKTTDTEAMRDRIQELLVAGDMGLGTRSPLYPLAQRLVPCTTCSAPKGEPCIPHDGPDREKRARRNHASHVDRRKAVAQHLSHVLMAAIMPEPGNPQVPRMP